MGLATTRSKVRSLPPFGVRNFGFLEGVTNFNLTFHVVDDHIHVGHGPGLRDVFLTEQLERQRCVFRRFSDLHFRLHRQFALDEETAGATGGVVDFHAGVWALGHLSHDFTDLAGGVELARTLPTAFSELCE